MPPSSSNLGGGRAAGWSRPRPCQVSKLRVFHGSIAGKSGVGRAGLAASVGQPHGHCMIAPMKASLGMVCLVSHLLGVRKCSQQPTIAQYCTLDWLVGPIDMSHVRVLVWARCTPTTRACPVDDVRHTYYNMCMPRPGDIAHLRQWRRML